MKFNINSIDNNRCKVGMFHVKHFHDSEGLIGVSFGFFC